VTALLRDHSVAIAILVGSGLVAWSVHRGFRSLEGVVRTQSSGVPASTTGTAPEDGNVQAPAAQAQPAHPTAPVATNVPPELLERDTVIRRQETAQNALLEQKGEYAKACWGPALSKGRPQSPPLEFHLQFDAQGNEIHREVEVALPPPLREPTDDLVAKCAAGGSVPKLHVQPPPGKVVNLRLSLEFP
jgi:hypothetical protein